MALREIRVMGDEVLNKTCKEVTKMTLRTKLLIHDMLDTMYDAGGVGLAAPQVGILKRIVVIDIGEGPIVLVNPEIVEESGEQTGEEGCLSVPGKSGIVTRPNHVMKIWSRSNWKEKNCLQEHSVMRSIIWMDISMWNSQKMASMMWSTRRTKNESYFHGNAGFFGGNTGSAYRGRA